MTDAASVLTFWFDEIEPKAWFEKNDAFDRQLIERFGALHTDAASGRLADWEGGRDSCLALLIVLDQFSRNMFRGSPKSFAQDGQALRIAKQAIAAGFDQDLEHTRKKFFYMPFEHSENIDDQTTCCELFKDFPGDDLKWAEAHRTIIERFGRFPHRNDILGRQSTAEEIEFLTQPNSSF